MSHTPPIPAGNQSPYPIAEPPHAHADAGLPVVVAEADDADESLTDRLRDLPLIAIGAVAGLGAVLVGAALFGLGRITPRGRTKRKARS